MPRVRRLPAPALAALWDIAGRQLWAYDVARGTRQPLQKHVASAATPSGSDVRISSDGKALELWKRGEQGWSRDASLLSLDRAR